MHTPPDMELEIFRLSETAQKRAIKLRAQRLRKKPVPKASQPEGRSAKQRTGDLFEDRACQHLEQAGLILLARQLRCPRGEIDLVLREADVLVFVEVRARSLTTFGSAAASITFNKQSRILFAIQWHLSRITKRFFAGDTPMCRIDVIAFDQGHLTWLRDAIRFKQDK